jgi:hypothetical protein
MYPRAYTDEFSYDLPDDLFDKEKGDIKPSKAKKKAVVNGKKQALKRSFDEVEVGLAPHAFCADRHTMSQVISKFPT